MPTVVFPYGEPGPERDAALSFVAPRYRLLGYETVVLSREGPWSKGETLRPLWNADADVFLIADADVLVERNALALAVDVVVSGRSAWAVPHSKVSRLDEQTTTRVYETGKVPRRIGLVRASYEGKLGGGIVVVSPDVWRAVPIDPRFVGWGGEDEAWGLALSTLVGPAFRVDSELLHLWHPHAAPGRPRYRWPERRESCDLLRLYRAASGHVEQMRRLVEQYRS